MEPVDGQVSCSMAGTLVRRVPSTLGEAAVDELLTRAGVRYAPDFLDDVGDWIWYRARRGDRAGRRRSTRPSAAARTARWSPPEAVMLAA